MPFFSNFGLVDYEFVENTSNTITNILQRVNVHDSVFSNASFYYDYYIQEMDRPDIIAHKLYGNVDYYWLVLLANKMINPFYDWPLNQTEMESFLLKKYKGITLFVDGISNPGFSRTETLTGGGPGTTASGEIWRWDRTYQRIEVYNNASGKRFGIGQVVTGGTSGATATIRRVVDISSEAGHHFALNADVDNPVLDPRDSSNNYLNGYITNSIDTHIITNRTHEENENENKRTISLLRPEYIDAAIGDLNRLL